jgi:hypothetical protein
MTMHLSDFGKHVAVTVPSQAESYAATNNTLQGIGG